MSPKMKVSLTIELFIGQMYNFDEKRYPEA